MNTICHPEPEDQTNFQLHQGEEEMANAEEQVEEKTKKQGKRRKRSSQQKEPGRIPEFKKETQKPPVRTAGQCPLPWSQGLVKAPLNDIRSA